MDGTLIPRNQPNRHTVPSPKLAKNTRFFVHLKLDTTCHYHENAYAFCNYCGHRCILDAECYFVVAFTLKNIILIVKIVHNSLNLNQNVELKG